MTNVLSRLAVAAVAIPIVLGAIYFGGWWLTALVIVAAVLGLHEFWLITKRLAPLAPAGYIGAVLAVVGAKLGGIEWMVGGVLTTLALAFVLKGVSAAKQAPTTSISATVLGAVWVGCGLAFTLLVRDLPDHGRLAALTVVLAVWAGDTLAYVGGRLLGRHKMAPNTSPGKTWEGFVFGTIATVFVTFVALYKSGYLTIGESVGLGFVLAIAAPMGDLFESMLKRDAGVKDAGSLLGGHGGMLDRLDALLFAAPAAYFCIAALGHA
jgi:phosphatidate cytidylyltransferase